MAGTKKVILASRDEDDRAFFTQLCEKNALELILPTSTDMIASNFLQGALLVLDSDDEEVLNAKYTCGIPAITHALREKLDPQRIIAVSDEYVFKNPQMKPPYSQFSNKQIRHNMIRKYTLPNALDSYGWLLKSCAKGEATTLADYFSPDTKIQKITLKSTGQRRLAVEALQTIMQKAGLSERLAAKLAQAGDEFMMNAIFDAPRDVLGRACKRELDRNAVIDLLDRDVVDFEIALDSQRIGVCVTDFYGSLIYEEVSRSLSLDYITNKYNVKRDTLGAGLGLYQTTYNGISTVYSVVEGKSTRAMVIFPVERSTRTFKENFEFMTSHFYK